jgi:uncharacterized protein YqgC (DUF456 family)
MAILLYVLGVALLAAGVAGLVVPVLPGALLLLAGVAALAWAGDFAILGWGTLGFAGAVALVMVAVDWAASVLGAKAFGASKWAVIGSAVGLLVGLFLGLPGILLGPAVGSSTPGTRTSAARPGRAPAPSSDSSWAASSRWSWPSCCWAWSSFGSFFTEGS